MSKNKKLSDLTKKRKLSIYLTSYIQEEISRINEAEQNKSSGVDVSVQIEEKLREWLDDGLDAFEGGAAEQFGIGNCTIKIDVD